MSSTSLLLFVVVDVEDITTCWLPRFPSGSCRRLCGVPALADFLRRHLFCRLRQESFILSHRHQKSTKQKIFGSGDEARLAALLISLMSASLEHFDRSLRSSRGLESCRWPSKSSDSWDFHIGGYFCQNNELRTI